MTKKDYITIATVINSQIHLWSKEQAPIVINAFSKYINDLAQVLQESNSRFDKEKFVKACGF